MALRSLKALVALLLVAGVAALEFEMQSQSKCVYEEVGDLEVDGVDLEVGGSPWGQWHSAWLGGTVLWMRMGRSTSYSRRTSSAAWKMVGEF
jgi:hypothetical protein